MRRHAEPCNVAHALRRHFEREKLACLRLPPGMPGQWHSYPIFLNSTTDMAAAFIGSSRNIPFTLKTIIVSTLPNLICSGINFRLDLATPPVRQSLDDATGSASKAPCSSPTRFGKQSPTGEKTHDTLPIRSSSSSSTSSSLLRPRLRSTANRPRLY